MKKTILLPLSLAFILASCSDEKETSKQENPDKGPLAQLVLESAPNKAIDIADMRNLKLFEISEILILHLYYSLYFTSLNFIIFHIF